MKKKQTIREILFAQVGNGKTQFHSRYTGLDRLVNGEIHAIANAMEKYIKENDIKIISN